MIMHWSEGLGQGHPEKTMISSRVVEVTRRTSSVTIFWWVKELTFCHSSYSSRRRDSRCLSVARAAYLTAPPTRARCRAAAAARGGGGGRRSCQRLSTATELRGSNCPFFIKLDGDGTCRGPPPPCGDRTPPNAPRR